MDENFEYSKYSLAVRSMFDVISKAMISLNQMTLSSIESEADVVSDEQRKMDVKLVFTLTWVKKDGFVTEKIVVPSAEQMMTKIQTRAKELMEANPGTKDPQYLSDVAVEEAVFSHRCCGT